MSHDGSSHSNQPGQEDSFTTPFCEQRVNGLNLSDNSLLVQRSIARHMHSSPLESDYEVPNPIADLAVSGGEILNQAVRNLSSAIDSSPVASELVHRGEGLLGETTKVVSGALGKAANVVDELRLQATEEITKGSEKITNTAKEVLKTTVDSVFSKTQNAIDDFSEEYPDLVTNLNRGQSQFVSFVGRTTKNVLGSVYQRAEQLSDSIIDFFEDSPSEFNGRVKSTEMNNSVDSSTLSKTSVLQETTELASVKAQNLDSSERSDSTIADNYRGVDFPVDQIISNLLEGTVSAAVISWKNGLAVENGGVINNAYYAQKKFGNVFSEGGRFSGWTVNQLQEGIAKEYIKLSDIPVEYVTKDGKTYILNTRSASALGGSGIPRDLWHVENKTGDSLAENRLIGQLERNSIKSSPPKYPLPSTTIKVPQQPISSSALKALEVAGGTTKFLQGVGKVAAPIAIAFDGYRLIDSYQQDGGTFGHNFQTTTGSVAGGWTGGLVGAQLGAQGGAALGGAIGFGLGGVSAIPGAAIGGLVGGVGGGILGAFTGSEVGEWIGSGEATKNSTTTFNNINRAVSEAFHDVPEKINQAEQNVSNAIQDTTKKASETASQVSQNVSNVVQDTSKKITEATHQASHEVSNVVQDTTQKSKQIMAQASQTVSNTVQETTKKASETLTQASQSVSNVVGETTKKVSEATQQAGQEITKASQQTGQEISNAVQDTTKKVSETANQAKETYKKATQWLGGLFGGK